MTLKLRMVVEVDFRSGVPAHLLALKRRLPDLRQDEVVCLIAKTGLQLAFAFRPREFDKNLAVTSVRVQLSTRRPWNPVMLTKYAESAGIELQGLRTFEQWWKS